MSSCDRDAQQLFRQSTPSLAFPQPTRSLAHLSALSSAFPPFHLDSAAFCKQFHHNPGQKRPRRVLHCAWKRLANRHIQCFTLPHSSFATNRLDRPPLLPGFQSRSWRRSGASPPAHPWRVACVRMCHTQADTKDWGWTCLAKGEEKFCASCLNSVFDTSCASFSFGIEEKIVPHASLCF